MIGCLTETTTCVVAKPLVINKFKYLDLDLDDVSLRSDSYPEKELVMIYYPK